MKISYSNNLFYTTKTVDRRRRKNGREKEGGREGRERKSRRRKRRQQWQLLSLGNWPDISREVKMLIKKSSRTPKLSHGISASD